MGRQQYAGWALRSYTPDLKSIELVPKNANTHIFNNAMQLFSLHAAHHPPWRLAPTVCQATHVPVLHPTLSP